MDSTAWSTFTALMEPGESLLWSGKPTPARMARAGAGLWILSGAIFLATGGYLLGPQLRWILSEGSNWSTVCGFLWGILRTNLFASVFLAFGLTSAAAPLLAYRRAKRAEDAVTNHKGLRVRGKQVEWTRVSDLGEPQVRTHADGSGDVSLQLRAGVYGQNQFEHPDYRRRDLFRAFIGIQNPEEARQLIREQTQKARLKATEEDRATFRSR